MRNQENDMTLLSLAERVVWTVLHKKDEDAVHDVWVELAEMEMPYSKATEGYFYTSGVNFIYNQIRRAKLYQHKLANYCNMQMSSI